MNTFNGCQNTEPSRAEMLSLCLKISFYLVRLLETSTKIQLYDFVGSLCDEIHTQGNENK